MERNRRSHTGAPGELSIMGERKNILRHIRDNRVTCIEGETGCGKSTKVPQFILDYQLKNGIPKENIKMIVTQPRRVAAVSLAKRVAQERDEEVGNTVGHRIGGDNASCASTNIIYATVGVLLQQLINQPHTYSNYNFIILDEVHERSIDSDMLSLVIKILKDKPENTGTKIIIMSATLQGQLFTKYFGDERTKPIFVGCKPFDVEEIYLEDLVDADGGFLYTLESSHVSVVFQQWLRFSEHHLEDGECMDRIREALTNLDDELRSKVRSLIDESNDDQRKFKTPTPYVDKTVYPLCAHLIQTLVVRGETILVFVPGIGDIDELCEILSPIEENYEKWRDTCNCPIRIFPLHSTIPKEDQDAVFAPPGEDVAHVVIATNIAESSLTLPKVRVVFDFGVEKQINWDKRKGMTTLKEGWISKASAKQRKGRTGRVFEGRVIRMYPRCFYENSMEDHEVPEILSCSLDKLVLQVKHLREKISCDLKPTELLKKAVSVPSIKNIDDALKSLADDGALLEEDELSRSTLLGHLAVRLPIDIRMSKVVLLGTLFGCPCDAVIIAASLSASMEPFTLPTLKIMKDSEKFAESIRNSTSRRYHYDNGLYSEPIMMRNMFIDWLHWVENNRGYTDKTYKWTDRKHLTRRFCGKNFLSDKRLKEFESSVIEIARRLLTLIDSETKAAKQLEYLIHLLRSSPITDYTPPPSDKKAQSGDLKKAKPELNAAIAHQLETLSIQASKEENTGARSKYSRQTESKPESGLVVDDLIEKDDTILKTIIAGAFTANLMVGNVKKKESEEKDLSLRPDRRANRKRECKDLMQHIKDQAYDPKRTIAIEHDIPNVEQKRQDVRASLATILGHSRTGEYDHALTEMASRQYIVIQFKENQEQNRKLIHDVPWKAHAINQYAEGNMRYFDAPNIGGKGRHAAILKTVEQPYRLEWTFMRGKEPAKIMAWRNPLGFACETEKRCHIGFPAQIMKTEKNNARQGVSTTYQAHKTTILPSEKHGLIAAVIVMCFVSQRQEVRVHVYDDDTCPRIAGISLGNASLSLSNSLCAMLDVEGGVEFNLHDYYCIRPEFIHIINEIRTAISNVFVKKRLTDNFTKIPQIGVVDTVKMLLDKARLSTTKPEDGVKRNKKGAENPKPDKQWPFNTRQPRDELDSSDSESDFSEEASNESDYEQEDSDDDESNLFYLEEFDLSKLFPKQRTGFFHKTYKTYKTYQAMD
ncbi:unnamed protein product [Owenia fusiformis]|uniref:Uncharacterized protein n=1 Tax=Owenia fusiformis TaxID=6347 RepID=A0A8J1XRP9_OWEFU|nr:unnamed protein product [Owenia fusiformis]